MTEQVLSLCTLYSACAPLALSTMETENLKWKSGGISGSEFASSARIGSSDEKIKCLLQTFSAALSHGPAETVSAVIALHCTEIVLLSH